MAQKNKKSKMSRERFDYNDGDDFNNEEDKQEEHEQGPSKRKLGKGGSEFSLDEVLRLGGTRADYIMLASVNESQELVDSGQKNSVDDLAEGELKAFITKLGIKAYSQRLHVIKEHPDEQDTDAATSSSTVTGKAEPVSQKAKAESSGEQQQRKEKKTKTKESKEKPGAVRKKAKTNANLFEFYPRKVLLIKPGGKWFDMEYTNEGDCSPQDVSVVSQYKALAQKLLEAEIELFKTMKSSQKGASSSWVKTVVSKGTLPDRMAALTLLIQDSPVHSLEFVENLVSLVKKNANRRQSMMAVDTFRELLMSDLLPRNRKLRTFSQHPFHNLEELASGNRDSRDRRLILWYFEHQLKHHVAEFVEALEVLARDTVMATKSQALTIAHELLCNLPEQEKALLVQIVNKLGDPVYRMAAKASYLLEILLHKHPSMKAVVCSEVERLMFRPNISPKAQYYAVCFLNQVVLSHDEAELASRLITIYFSFFHACVKKKDIESKMLSALLSGVNRAYPYANSGDEKIREQMDTLFKVVHLVKFNTAVQALMLLFQVMDSQQAISDRYYVALYRKLLDPGLSLCSIQGMFLNLLYKSLKSDIILRRIKAFVKRLLQVSCEQNPTFACAALFLVSEVMKAKPGLRMLLQEPEAGEEETFKDILDDDDEEEESFTDVDKVEEGKSDNPGQHNQVASWVHHQNLEAGKSNETYDPLHRNPLFCGADHTTLWELWKVRVSSHTEHISYFIYPYFTFFLLSQLSRHFHPSVALFAKTILQGDFIQYTGDPLQDFTLIRFLDRFVFRNPKQQKVRENTDSTVMQSKPRVSMNEIRSKPVNSKEFLAKEESEIPVNEVFFYRFFKKREAERPLQRQREDGDNESLEDVDDEEFERVLDSYEGDSYFTTTKDDSLDFAGNVKGKSKKRRKEDDDSNSDIEEDLDDEEVSLGSMDEEDFGDELEEEGGTFMDMGDVGDEDEEVAADSGDEMDEIAEFSARSKGKRKKSEDFNFCGSIGIKAGRKKKKKGMKDEEGMFASADEFGHLLDENAGSKFDTIGIDAVANKDKASLKQLKWEAQRDDWIQGRDVKTLRKKKAAFQKKKKFSKIKGGEKHKNNR
ncbi:CCAAT/enhancer-binding protein zeta [Arapaima gigas]